MAVEDWSNTAANNTTIGSIAIGENAMSVNDINNVHREFMKQIADWRDGAIAALGASGDYQPLDATLTALAGVTTAADKLIYATAADAFSTADITSYGRTLIALANVAALKSSLGVVTATAQSLSSPGYIKLDIDGDGSPEIMVQWGTGSIGANTTGTISYPQSFSTFAICVVSGGSSNASREGDVHVYQNSGLSSQAIIHSSPGTVSYQWIAVGGAA